MTNADPTTGPRPRLRALRGHLSTTAPELFALSGLAIAQPLLDLFGRNPEFFVASESSRAEIVAFALVLAFLVPVALTLLGGLTFLVAGARVARAVHRVSFTLLAVGLGLAVAAQVGVTATAVALVLAVAVAVALIAARHRFAGVRLMLRYLGLAPLFFLGLFLFASASGELLRQDEADAASGVQIGSDAPVVMVMFDELPLASLLREDGTLNEARFPNFARLAAGGTWYRNATSVSASTVRAVPAALAGVLPEEGQVPTSSDYPDNLFTLLGGRYRTDVSETLTDLCPSSVCEAEGSDGLSRFVDHLGGALTDASVVYGHVVLPEAWSDDLPTVDQSWEGFLGGAEPDTFEESVSVGSLSLDDEEDRTEFFDRMRDQNRDAFAGLKGEALLRAVEEATFGPERLFFAHESFPHFVWERTPEGGVYEGDGGPPGVEDGRWSEDARQVRQGLQRHLLQVGYADTVLGELIDRLEAAGVWEEAMVIVAADHGIAFRAGSPTRQPTERTVSDIYRVPLFVKAPGQTEGRPDDRNALLTDILPTVIDLLDVEVDWDLDGVSLVGPPRDDDHKPVVYSGPDEVPGDFEQAVEVARRNTLLLPFQGPWPTVARVGPDARLVGRPLGDLRVEGPAAVDWSVDEGAVLDDYDPGAEPIPLVLHGSLVAQRGDPPADGLLVLNGRVAGAVVVEDTDGDEADFTVLIDHGVLRAGRNAVQLLLPDRDGPLPAWRVAVRAD